ncbi:MAG: GNAT family N-acetyltransferase [Actinomycetota bacterium]|nr:GNAT family N-acetyltransferase [Actinomycetota bacterium]
MPDRQPPPRGPLEILSSVGPALTAARLYSLLRLRVDIFVVEQNCPYHELDGRDLLDTTTHFWTSDGDGVASAVRVLADPAGARIGRVVTRVDRRGEGLAPELLHRALAQFGSGVTVLDARSHLRAFYERFGYELDGPEFVEDVIPHLPMTRPAGH